MSHSAPPPDDDINKGPLVLALCTVTTSVALIAVGTRIFVRVRIVKNVGWDDYTILGAMVTFQALPHICLDKHRKSSDE
jgi:hypothetical protein